MNEKKKLRLQLSSLSNFIGSFNFFMPNQTSMFVCQNTQSPNFLFPRTGHDRSNSNMGCASNPWEKQKVAANRENSPSSFLTAPSSNCFSQSTCLLASRPSSICPKGLVHYVNQNLASPASESPVQYDSLTVLQYKRGVEEPCKFQSIDVACTDATRTGNMPVAMKKQRLKVGTYENEQQGLFYGLRGRKNHEREGRINEESAALMEEIKISEMFDKILLSEEEPEPFTSIDGKTSSAAVRNLSLGVHTRCSSGRRNRAKKGKNNDDMVDVKNLLVLCAEAISTGDSRSAGDLLKQIRLRSCPVGDARQRLARAFADALHARLAGTAVQSIFTCSSLKKTPISELLKPQQTYYKAFPFSKAAIYFADNMILKVAEAAKTLHVVDFGILFRCQWPLLIRLLSRRPGGPPNFRLTGIEYPQHGPKPEERIVEAGHHFAKYCERFGVPFEYNAIVSQHWETIKIEELKIRRNEVLAVNCHFRFENLLDGTVVVKSPRDAVLKLVREMRPDIFTLSVVNGTFNSPFFVPRFRQALFHFSALYNMLDCNIPRDDIYRFHIEREYYGRKIMNVVACEGKERVERPETYKQWHRRVSQAGFRQRPLDKRMMKICMNKVKLADQKDLLILEDSNWMLQGWKGRILHASSSWEPA